MDTLQFINAITGHLAWPLTAVALSIVFRRSLVELLGRVRKLKWGEKEAELVEAAAAEVQNAVEEASKALPDGEGEPEQRERIDHLVRRAAAFGFAVARSSPNLPGLPPTSVDWDKEPPEFDFISPTERTLWDHMAKIRQLRPRTRSAGQFFSGPDASLNTNDPDMK